MIFSSKNTIEEHVIEVLDFGSTDGPTLLGKILDSGLNITKQALYKSLRKLIEGEVVNKVGKNYSINRLWLQKVKKFTERHVDKNIITKQIDISSLENGDSLTYQFRNPFHMDVVWGHLFDIIYESTPREITVLNHHPHEWLILSRPETEKFWLNRFKQDKKIMLFTISGDSQLDKKFKKDWNSENIKISTGISHGLPINKYLSVVGDYIFEISTDLKFEHLIDEFFKNNKTIDEVSQKQIQSISKMKYRSKLKLTKNRKRADLLRKKYKKEFYVPKPYI
jgi:hypothetical protein